MDMKIKSVLKHCSFPMKAKQLKLPYVCVNLDLISHSYKISQKRALVIAVALTKNRNL